MSERVNTVDDDTMKFGLLMESAQAHQKLAEAHLERLRTHTRDLDGVVRDEIRRTLVEELQSLAAETDRAARALQGMRRAAHLHVVLWNLGAATLCTAIPAAIVHWSLPSAAEIAALRGQRDALASNIAGLERRGGRVDWRSCGDAGRLCVRIDRKASIYGENRDFYVVKGF
jgi:uncharacterized protein involved in exopolysaccharide biosynthesis